MYVLSELVHAILRCPHWSLPLNWLWFLRQARTADILEDAEIEFDAVQDALERSGASKECIQNHLAFVKAFKKVEDEKEACEPDDDPQYSPLPQPSFDTLDVSVISHGSF
jgi:hypothetical protein